MISLIAAVGANREIGKNNTLIWHLPSDLKYFKEKTLNHKVIMGYNTYLSIGSPLPKRINIVIVDDAKKINDNRVIVYTNIEEMIKKEIKKEEECFIIGGASMYQYFYPLADKMYLTLIKATDSLADTYFPAYESDDWKINMGEEREENGIKFNFATFTRK